MGAKSWAIVPPSAMFATPYERHILRAAPRELSIQVVRDFRGIKLTFRTREPKILSISPDK